MAYDNEWEKEFDPQTGRLEPKGGHTMTEDKVKKEKILRGSKLRLDGTECVTYVKPSKLKGSLVVIRESGRLDCVDLKRIAGYETFRL